MADDPQLIQYTAENWHLEASQHEEVAATIAQARVVGADIHYAADSLGPIMHAVKSAVADLVPVRDAALAKHEERQTALAAALRNATNSNTAANEVAAAAVWAVAPTTEA